MFTRKKLCFPDNWSNCFLFYGNQVLKWTCFILPWYEPPTHFCFLLFAVVHRTALRRQRPKTQGPGTNSPWYPGWPTAVFRLVPAFLPRVQPSVELLSLGAIWFNRGDEWATPWAFIGKWKLCPQQKTLLRLYMVFNSAVPWTAHSSILSPGLCCVLHIQRVF